MLFPSKVCSYSSSCLAYLPTILAELDSGEKSVLGLHVATHTRLPDINHFLDALVCLFALGRISYSDETGRLHIAS